MIMFSLKEEEKEKIKEETEKLKLASNERKMLNELLEIRNLESQDV